MLEVTKKVKKVVDEAAEAKKVINNHEEAAKHHEAAAHHHSEAAKHYKEGNKETACGCGMKAKGESKLAKKLQKKNLKKYATVAK